MVSILRHEMLANGISRFFLLGFHSTLILPTEREKEREAEKKIQFMGFRKRKKWYRCG